MAHNSGVDALDETNFAVWNIKMEALLDEKELWDVVSGEEETPQTGPNSKAMKAFVRKQCLARALIIRHVAPSQVSHCFDHDPKLLWENLSRVHRARGFGTILAMRRRFFTMLKDSDQSMQAWVAAVRQAAFNLDAAGFEVQDLDLIIALTQSLPDSYSALIVTLDNTSVDELTVENVITRLLNEEACQSPEYRPVSDKGTVMLARHHTPHVHAEKSSTTSSVAPDEIRCFNCRGRGHTANICPSPKCILKDEKAYYVHVAAPPANVSDGELSEY